jgi:hypothetical protein
VTQVANTTDVGSFISALESARVGMRRGPARLAADALVQSPVDRTQVQASARVMRTVDQTLGTIINVRA